MKFYLISDNVDTQVGMRLAGIDGVVVHEREEVRKALHEQWPWRMWRWCHDGNAHPALPRACLRHEQTAAPLIVEIPDRHGNGRTKDSITRYVREAIGVKI